MTTTATNLDAVIRKIADLRRLATSSNLHEAEVAAAAAARLAEKHRISEAEIEEAGTEPGEQAVQDREVLDDDRGRTIVWKRSLASILSAHFGCALVRVPEKVDESFVYRLLIVGRPSDTAIVRYLYAWLSLDLARIATREGRGRGASWKRSWLVGAVTGIREQLTKAAATERATAGAAALVRLDQRGAAAMEALRSLYPNTRARKARPTYVQRDAYADGHEHGKNVHLGGQIEGRAVRQLGT